MKHVLEMQKEEEEWNPVRKDPTEEINRSFFQSAEEGLTPLEEMEEPSKENKRQEQLFEEIPQADFFSQHSPRYSPNSSLDCNFSKTAPDFSISSFKIE
jgi:hypothetical protein